jgi:5-methyltetrahydropteroyltriglutamate--homocysteine methyltransferase
LPGKRRAEPVLIRPTARRHRHRQRWRANRQHFVTTFIEHLSGVDFEKREVVKIRNRYDASVPTVVGAVERQKPVFVEDARLRQLTSQPIKWALPGPMTMIDTLYDNHYKSREKLAWEFAKILNQEARELEAAGVDIIQFDEPAFNVFFDEVNDWGIAALERAIEGLKCETAVHICYGYGIKANTDWKKTLGTSGANMKKRSLSCKHPTSILSHWSAITRGCLWICSS